VMTFETYHDAKRVMDVLGKRLGRFGLTLHPDKTRFIDFRPQRHGGTPPDCKAQSFDFLGLTHAWGKSRKGKDVVRTLRPECLGKARCGNHLRRLRPADGEQSLDEIRRPVFLLPASDDASRLEICC
jgi:hypothetical protein